MHDIDELINFATDEFERDGTLSCSTFSELTQHGIDAEALMEDLRG